MKKLYQIFGMKIPADNGRSGKIAALVPQKWQCKLGSCCPTGSSAKPQLRKAAGMMNDMFLNRLNDIRRRRCISIEKMNDFFVRRTFISIENNVNNKQIARRL